MNESSFKPSFSKDGMDFYDVKKCPFDVYGMPAFYQTENYIRLPENVADNSGEEGSGIPYLNTNPAGGRIRFKTDSRRIAIRHESLLDEHGINQSFLGSAGSDLYIDNRFYNSFCIPDFHFGKKGGYEACINLGDGITQHNMHDMLINLPLYHTVDKYFVGIESGSKIENGNEYKYKKPVVFYGSSITQGGCASRPGMAYPAIISRRYDTDYINIGFSGNGRAQPPIVEYMSGLEMSMFVSDYDYNSPSPEHLNQSLKAMFEKIREKKPGLPFIFVSRPNYFEWNDPQMSVQRRMAVYEVYENARKKGDQNIYYIDGDGLCAGEFHEDCTVDSCHPNDLGFWRMADVIGRAVGKFLQRGIF